MLSGQDFGLKSASLQNTSAIVLPIDSKNNFVTSKDVAEIESAAFNFGGNNGSQSD